MPKNIRTFEQGAGWFTAWDGQVGKYIVNGRKLAVEISTCAVWANECLAMWCILLFKHHYSTVVIHPCTVSGTPLIVRNIYTAFIYLFCSVWPALIRNCIDLTFHSTEECLTFPPSCGTWAEQQQVCYLSAASSLDTDLTAHRVLLGNWQSNFNICYNIISTQPRFWKHPY